MRSTRDRYSAVSPERFETTGREGQRRDALVARGRRVSCVLRLARMETRELGQFFTHGPLRIEYGGELSKSGGAGFRSAGRRQRWTWSRRCAEYYLESGW